MAAFTARRSFVSEPFPDNSERFESWPRSSRASVESTTARNVASVSQQIRAHNNTASVSALAAVRTLLGGAGGNDFVHIWIEDLHLDDDPPQIHLHHFKKEWNRYVPIMPAVAPAQLYGRRQGYLFETNLLDCYSVRTMQASAGIQRSGCIHICCDNPRKTSVRALGDKCLRALGGR